LIVTQKYRTHEVTFCARVKTWAETFFKNRSDLPFARVDIEESRDTRRKRSDLRFYRSKTDRNPIVAGEVKMPGTVEGRNPYDYKLVEDAHLKATSSGARFFFTWNVNKLVLFDQKLWEKPLIERRVNEFDLGLDLHRPEDVERAEVEPIIIAFVEKLLVDLADIIEGRRIDWGLPPDLLFIRAFESHISWPVKLTADYLATEAERNSAFDKLLQEWMTKQQSWLVARSDPEVWRELIDRAARTLCYVFANRLIFYESVRKKFEALAELRLPSRAKGATDMYKFFAKRFQDAVEYTGDYETLFYPEPEGGDWAGPLIFQHENARDAWAAVLENLRPFNFSNISSDILGAIFKRLIAPEERHKFGQHYTNEELVDLINSFCIRRANDTVLDPACGSGSFLVRVYHRKHWLDPKLRHDERLAHIFGVDISLFAAHLSTLNLAARDIKDEANYPRIARRNFFEIRDDKPFCYLPGLYGGESAPVMLPKLDAVVGNPPYVRQELIPKKKQRGVKPMQSKEDISDLVARRWPGLRLSGRSDLHCYFWPMAASFLNDGGWFGFLVSSSWLDVDYGFRLQEWVLSNFNIHVIFESTAEPWFEDARVKTCAVVLQRCASEKERMAQIVKFVRLDVPLREILGRIEEGDENQRQKRTNAFRDLVSGTKENKTTDRYRIIVKRQRELWDEGLRAGRIFELQRQRRPGEAASSGDEDDENEDGETESDISEVIPGGYGAGKWGKYLRAPDLYFEIMRDYGSRFVALGEIAEIRFGVKSGCDKFFMPRDVTAKFLAKYDERQWRNAPLHTHCKRHEVESGSVRLVEDGMGEVHPIEQEYLAPEVHSLMSVSRPIIRGDELKRLILLVSEPLSDLKSTYVEKYLRYGARSTFASKKSKAVPIPQRATCASRTTWYDLTYTTAGQLVWPKSQQYRHVIVYNTARHIVNCNLYDVTVVDDDNTPADLLAAILNSTLVGLTKFYFGRFAGTEGNLKTEVVDVNLLEVPNPKFATDSVGRKLREAFARLCERDIMPMVESAFIGCHSPREAKKLAQNPVALPHELQMPDRRALDLAVLELLGVSDPQKREDLCHRLYFETASHFRNIRIVEIQKQEQRTGTGGDRLRIEDLASDVWDALDPTEKLSPVAWIAERVTGESEDIEIHEGKPKLHDATDMFSANVVHFVPEGYNARYARAIEYPSRAHAELIVALASDGARGNVRLPTTEAATVELLHEYRLRQASLQLRFAELARSRTADEEKVHEITNLLSHWLVLGKPA
jgi:methylase of polypeptide subunit release factors